MVRAAKVLPLIPIALIASPAAAGDRVRIAVPASQLDQAIISLGRQTGVSIGLRDPKLARVPVKSVHGPIDVGTALKRMLRGTDARARQVAANSWLIERAPRPLPPVQLAQALPTLPEPIQEIVVTATKRDVPLSAYAGAAEVIQGNALSYAEAARGTSAIEVAAASLGSTHLGPGRNKLFIRGVADSSFVGPTQATVGQYWGNTRITYSAPDPNLRLHDVRAIEVLEGPQGTLYGAGSLGGVVRVVPEAPLLGMQERGAWAGAQATQHGDPGVDVGTLINVPVIDDTLAVRALAYGAVEGGYIDDRLRGLRDVNRVRTYGGRAALRYAPGEDWLVDVSAVGQSIEGRDSQYADRNGGGLSRESTISQPFRNDYVLADLSVTKRWDDMEFAVSAGLVDQYVFEQYAGLVGPARIVSGGLTLPVSAPIPINIITPVEYPIVAEAGVSAGFAQANRVRMVTSEARLSRRGKDGGGWLIGAAVMRNDARVSRRIDLMLTPSALTGVNNRADEATLFGEATLVPLRNVAVTLGGRLTHSRLSGEARDSARAFALRIDPEAEAKRDETRFLPSIAVSVRPAEGLNLFARYQEGFRPGGLAIQRDYVQRFNGDRVATAEIGLRYSGRGAMPLDLQLIGAWTRWSDIQADLIDGLGFPTTANIGDGRILSAGITARWRPMPDLELDAALYVNGSRVTSPAQVLSSYFASARAASHAELPNVADVSARAGFSWSVVLRDDVRLTTSGYGRYVGQSTLGIGPVLGQAQGDTLDTGLDLRIGRPEAGLSLSLTNLLDARGNRFALGSPFLVNTQNQITPLRPRTIRIGFDVTF